MDTKFTAGPWEAIGNLVRSAMSDGGFLIAECRDGNGQPHSDEANANARLIAAAPELFEALTEIDKRFRQCMLLGLSAEEAFDSFYQLIVSDALAKATGEQA